MEMLYLTGQTFLTYPTFARSPPSPLFARHIQRFLLLAFFIRENEWDIQGCERWQCAMCDIYGEHQLVATHNVRKSRSLHTLPTVQGKYKVQVRSRFFFWTESIPALPWPLRAFSTIIAASCAFCNTSRKCLSINNSVTSRQSHLQASTQRDREVPLENMIQTWKGWGSVVAVCMGPWWGWTWEWW